MSCLACTLPSGNRIGEIGLFGRKGLPGVSNIGAASFSASFVPFGGVAAECD